MISHRSHVKNRSIIFFLIFAISIVVWGCGNGSDGGSGNTEPNAPHTDEDPGEEPSDDQPTDSLITGRATLGRLTGASVTIYECPDTETVIFQTTTSESDTMDDAGIFHVPQSLFSDNTAYLIAVTGGTDVDTDNDGIFDEMSVENAGTLYLAAMGEQLKSGDFKVNILSDLIYYKLAYMFLATYSGEDISSALETCVPYFLKDDVDGDGDTDYYDILAWEPISDKENVTDTVSLTGYAGLVRNNSSFQSRAPVIRDRLVSQYGYPVLGYPRYYLALWEKTAYTTYASGIEVFDIKNPYELSKIGSFQKIEGEGYSYISASGQYLYARLTTDTLGEEHIQVLLNNGPSSLYEIGRIEDSRLLTISGDYLYARNTSSEEDMTSFQIIDITTPETLFLMGSVTCPNYLLNADVWNKYAITAHADTGIRIIDISDPHNPEIIGAFDTPDGVSQVEVSNGYAYLLKSYPYSIKIVDIRAPETPVLVNTLTYPAGIEGITISGNHAYFYNSEEIWQTDVSNPADLSMTGYFILPCCTNHIAISDGYTYRANGYGIEVYNFNDFADNTLLCMAGLPEKVYHLYISGDYAYIGGTNVHLLNISNPYQPLVCDVYISPGQITSTRLSAGENHFKQIWTPTNENLIQPSLGEWISHKSECNIVVSGGYAYVANGSSTVNIGGLYIYDISNPAEPVQLANILTSEWADNVILSGNYAYVTIRDGGVFIIDITAPESPEEICSIQTGDTICHLTISGNYLYVANDGSGLRIIDISDPATAYIISSLTLSEKTWSVGVSGDYAYTANGEDGFHVINIADPENPVVVNTLNIGGDARVVAIYGVYAYIGNNMTGVDVVDIRNPENPVPVAALTAINSVSAITVSNNYVYVAGGKALAIYPAPPLEL